MHVSTDRVVQIAGREVDAAVGRPPLAVRPLDERGLVARHGIRPEPDGVPAVPLAVGRAEQSRQHGRAHVHPVLGVDVDGKYAVRDTDHFGRIVGPSTRGVLGAVVVHRPGTPVRRPREGADGGRGREVIGEDLPPTGQVTDRHPLAGRLDRRVGRRSRRIWRPGGGRRGARGDQGMRGGRPVRGGCARPIRSPPGRYGQHRHHRQDNYRHRSGDRNVILAPPDRWPSRRRPARRFPADISPTDATGTG